MNYWNECIAEAFEDAGITATDEQINTVASWAEGAHDNYSMANGHDVIGNPVETQAQEELRTLKAEAEKKRQWELSTEPCKECNTSGRTRDGWGRDQICRPRANMRITGLEIGTSILLSSGQLDVKRSG